MFPPSAAVSDPRTCSVRWASSILPAMTGSTWVGPRYRVPAIMDGYISTVRPWWRYGCAARDALIPFPLGGNPQGGICDGSPGAFRPAAAGNGPWGRADRRGVRHVPHRHGSAGVLRYARCAFLSWDRHRSL